MSLQLKATVSSPRCSAFGFDTIEATRFLVSLTRQEGGTMFGCWWGVGPCVTYSPAADSVSFEITEVPDA